MPDPLATIAELEAKIAAIGDDPTPERGALLTELAYYLRGSEQWERMHSLATEAMKIAKSSGDAVAQGRALGMVAFVQYIRSDLKSALANCMEALRLVAGDAKSDAQIRVALGMVQWTLGNFDEALRHMDRTLPALREAGDKISLAFATSAKGGVLHSLAQYDLAVACHQDALTLFRETGFEVGVGRALSGLGSAYQAVGLLTAALECHQESLQIAEGAKHLISLSRALTDLGEVYEAQGRIDEAIASHQRALEIREQQRYLQPQTTNLFHLGRIQNRLGDTSGALEYLRRGLAIAEEIGARPKTCDFHQVLSEIYERIGDLANALHHYKEFERIKTVLFSDQTTLRHKALELEAQLEIHRLKNVELARLLKELQATQAELLSREKMAALGSLVAALAHEINSPLGVIQSSADLTSRCAAKLGAASQANGTIDVLQTNARLIGEASQRIAKLVNSLKMFAHLDRAEFGEMDVVQSLEHTLALLEPEFRGRVTVNRDYQPVPRLNAYVGELNQVFMNLLRNAAQAIEGSGVINVQTRTREQAVQVSVVDSGRGIPPELRERIFTPGFNTDGARVRGSFSLFGSLNIARKHGGNIEFSSVPGEGSTFTLTLPSTLISAPV